MAGVYRSSINLIRWRGAVPNALNAGRVEAFLGAGAIGDVQAGVAREASVQGIVGTLAGYMPYLPQIDGRVQTIAANGAQQSTSNTIASGINTIYGQMTGPGVVVQPNTYVISKTIQRGDMALNNGGTTGNSVIGAVNLAKARLGWGGGACMNTPLIPAQTAPHKLWISAPTLLSGERGYVEGNDNLRWEVEEKP